MIEGGLRCNSDLLLIGSLIPDCLTEGCPVLPLTINHLTRVYLRLVVDHLRTTLGICNGDLPSESFSLRCWNRTRIEGSNVRDTASEVGLIILQRCCCVREIGRELETPEITHVVGALRCISVEIGWQVQLAVEDEIHDRPDLLCLVDHRSSRTQNHLGALNKMEDTPELVIDEGLLGRANVLIVQGEIVDLIHIEEGIGEASNNFLIRELAAEYLLGLPLLCSP